MAVSLAKNQNTIFWKHTKWDISIIVFNLAALVIPSFFIPYWFIISFSSISWLIILFSAFDIFAPHLFLTKRYKAQGNFVGNHSFLNAYAIITAHISKQFPDESETLNSLCERFLKNNCDPMQYDFHLSKIDSITKAASATPLHTELLKQGIIENRNILFQKTQSLVLHFSTHYDITADWLRSVGRGLRLNTEWVESQILTMQFTNDEFTSEQERTNNQWSSVRVSKEDEFFECLEINNTDDFVKIRKAFIEKAKQYHPDHLQHLQADELAAAEAKFKNINEAYTYFSEKYHKRN